MKKPRYTIEEIDNGIAFRIWDNKKKLEVCTTHLGTGAIKVCEALNAQEKKKKKARNTKK